ncbi:cell wall hydrolase [Novosphingobium sp. CF614]|uniref:cell wall hydrolase n=1 Tax=Novosphingobium sp. CF614 TaxID=1884364 RepID=UPI000AC8135C|nr:cell wall hydrolase [Novosphingobium sp. CF614]
MRSKVQWASAIALAATVLTLLFSAQGSGAVASDMVPILTKREPAVEFVSQPVVQPLPAEAVAEAPADSLINATSLSQLVSRQAIPQPLSGEMRCLAGAIYFEARGESLEGQLAVGRVIVNRAESGRFPGSYCGVVYQPSQFSFVRGRAMPAIRESSRDWHEALAIAQIAHDGSWKTPAKGALFFHAASVSPNWRLTRLARVDNHIFYR